MELASPGHPGRLLFMRQKASVPAGYYTLPDDESTMRFLIRIVAVFAAVSVLGTVWFVAAFATAGGARALLGSGLLGGLTVAGWVIALVVGPVATVQLWRFRQSGRRAGIILFGYGLAYYLVGLLALRSPEASIGQIFAAAAMFALPLLVLLLPGTRILFANG